jgi:hypothetical protein
MEPNVMRTVFALGLLIALSASANAATVHRFKLHERHLGPAQRVTVPERFAVPGWTDEETERWLYNGSLGSSLG